MDNRQETIKKIKTLLRAHHNGLTITDIAQKLELNRNSTAKYLEILLISGDVNLNTYGPAKVYTVSQRMPISAMVKFSADIIILIDNDMRVLDANENALSILGLSRDDLVGNRIDTINSPLLVRLAIPEVFDEIQKNGEIQREFAITSHNEDHHYRVRLIPTVFDNLEDGLTIIGEDITKQIRFEESLMVSEARYRGIVQDQTDFICRWRPDGTATFINEPLGRFLGISCSDASGKSIFSYISPEDLPLVNEKIAGIAVDQPTGTIEMRVMNHEGVYRWNVWSNRAIFDNTGTFIECQSVGQDITERREAEETLTRIRKAVDSSSEAIGISTPDGRHIYQNPAFTSMFGYSQEELSKPLGPVVLYEDTQEGCEIFETIMKGDSCSGEIVMVSKEGRRSEVSYHADAIRDDTGCIIGLIGIHTDITERKRVEKALSDSELLYRTILNNIQDIYYRCDPEGTIVMVSPSAPKLLGYDSVDEIIGEKITEKLYLHPDEREIFLKAIYENQKTTDYEVTLKKHDGSPVVISTNSNLLFDSDGHVTGIEGFIRDITFRKNAETALRESEERYRGVVEDQTEFICRFTPDGTHVFVNEAYCRYFGLNREEIIGSRFRPLIHPEDRENVTRLIASLNSEHPLETIEHRIIMPDGSIRWQRWVDRAIFSADGHLKEYQSVGRDITDRRQVEETVIASLKRARDQQAVLGTISYSPYIFSGDVEGLTTSLTEVSSGVLGVERASVWLFNSTEDELRCIDLYEASCGRHSCDAVLKRHEYENEFDALNTAKYIDANDPSTDPRTVGYVEGYIRVNRITSLLDAVIRVTGQNLGVLCFEHVDRPHLWDSDEIAFACQLADQIAITLMNRDRKQAELALKESEERYRNVVEDQTEFICRFKPDGTITFLNDAYCRYFGLNKEKCIGHHHNVVLPPEDALTMKTHLASLSPKNPVQTVEHRILTLDGNIVWHSWSDRAIFNPEGKVVEYQSVGRDITQKMERIQKIRESEERFHMIANLSPFPIF
jgi:PAS domain S-box-containing protein